MRIAPPQRGIASKKKKKEAKNGDASTDLATFPLTREAAKGKNVSKPGRGENPEGRLGKNGVTPLRENS